MTSSRELTPRKLRAILAGIFIFLIALGVVIFILGYKQITQYSRETQQKAVDARVSDSKVTDLIAIKDKLDDHAAIVTQASQLVSESTLYAYQDQIITDINAYAREAGVTLDNITFNDSAAASTTAPTSTTATAIPAGVKTMTATVTFKNPVNYTAFLRFVHSLEQSLFRMSILGIDIAKSTDSSAPAKDTDFITCGPINIEVYVK